MYIDEKYIMSAAGLMSSIDRDKAIICVVGNFIAEKAGTTIELFETLKGIPIRMISYGGSRHNVSLLVNSEHKVEALRALSKTIFSK